MSSIVLEYVPLMSILSIKLTLHMQLRERASQQHVSNLFFFYYIQVSPFFSSFPQFPFPIIRSILSILRFLQRQSKVVNLKINRIKRDLIKILGDFPERGSFYISYIPHRIHNFRVNSQTFFHCTQMVPIILFLLALQKDDF